MTKLVLDDELLDAQVLRAVGAARYGGADVGECLQVAHEADGANLDSWHEAWVAAAQRVCGLAQAEEGDHCEAGARSLYHAKSFGWLDDLLHPGVLRPPTGAGRPLAEHWTLPAT